ncbi:MAG: toll/interleukin-1 receptor domain-containing protein [Candidatus Aminicenantes bacterium]|nr:toll/interleukin-1 receptor domain-containing protein [Candidatus Aminicenantes bacterium]
MMYWELFMRKLRDKKIIPVVGNDLCLVKNQDDKPIPLHRYIAKELTRRLGIPYEGQCIRELDTEFKGSKIMEMTQSIYFQIKEDRFYTKPLEKLAEITDFNFYISISLDNQLEKALRKKRNLKKNELKILEYSVEDNDMQEDVENGSPVTLFNLLGNIEDESKSAFSEEEILENFFSLSNKEEPHPLLADYFMNQINGRILLFMGCDFPDWFMRFIIRILTNKRYMSRKLPHYFFNDEINQYKELENFLKKFKIEINPTEIGQGGNLTAFIDELHRKWSDTIQSQYDGSVLLSYNHLDQEKAKTLKQLLKAQRIRDVWLDIDDLHVGLHQDLIEEEIIKCKVFMPLISKNSLNDDQSYMWTVEWAYIEGRLNADKTNHEKRFEVIPIILDNTARDDVRIPIAMRKFTILELDKYKDTIIAEVKEILTSLKEEHN